MFRPPISSTYATWRASDIFQQTSATVTLLGWMCIICSYGQSFNNETPPRTCISGFGLRAVATSRSSNPTKAQTGSAFGYMAPEVFSTNARPSKKADMYASGMVASEVIVGARPFGKPKLMELPLLAVYWVFKPTRPKDSVAPRNMEILQTIPEQTLSTTSHGRAALEHSVCVVRTSTVPTQIRQSGLVNQPVEPEASSRLENSSRSAADQARYLFSDNTPSQIICSVSESPRVDVNKQLLLHVYQLTRGRGGRYIPPSGEWGTQNPPGPMPHHLEPPRPAFLLAASLMTFDQLTNYYYISTSKQISFVCVPKAYRGAMFNVFTMLQCINIISAFPASTDSPVNIDHFFQGSAPVQFLRRPV